MPRQRKGPKFFVSRQRYWGVDEEEGTVVEIAYGGSDYANPDMLTTAYGIMGEGKEYHDPREAVEAAIRVCDAWRADGETNAKVAMGATGGNTIPFEPKTYDEARKRAEELYEKLPKCAECGEPLGDETFSHDLTCDDEKFCSERCAEKNYNDIEEANKTYKVVRKYQDEDLGDEEIKTGLTLEEAKAHCNDKESSSRTCTSAEGIRRTEEHGPWFDAYYEED